MSLDPTKTYLEWNGTTFPNSANAQFKAPEGSTIDWGDGTVETFDTASTVVNTHTYSDGKATHTIIISGLTGIGDSAFQNCKNLTSIAIPDSIISIGSGAFSSCSGLTSITIPNSVTSIAGGAFYLCSSLTNVTIGSGLTSIGFNAFGHCSSLKTIVLFPETPPTLGSTNAIPTTTTIYVQQSSKGAYKTATNWTAFASSIFSDNTYLSFVRFNKKNKEYIEEKILEIAYPVDSVYFSLTDTSPASIVGGTWSRLGAYTLSPAVTSDSLTVYAWKRLS